MEWKSLPCVEFVAWLDQFREEVEAGALRKIRQASALDVAEGWANIMLSVWQKNMTGEQWNDELHVRRWLHGCMFRQLCTLWRNAHHRRRHEREGQVWSTYFISELQREEMKRVVEIAERDKPKEQAKLGPSRDWLWQAVRDLTPIRQRAVELCIVGELTAREAGAIEGVSRVTMKARLQMTRNALRETLADHVDAA